MKKVAETMAKYRAMEVKELEEELTKVAMHLFHLRSVSKSGQQVKSHFFKDYKKTIARIQTVLNEKKAK